MKRVFVLLALALAGCEDEKKICPEPTDRGKAECLEYGAVYIETKTRIICHLPSGTILEQRK